MESWNAVAPEVFAEQWKAFVALPAPPKMAELAIAPGKVVRKYFKCLILKDEKLTTTLSEWFVLSIESDVKALLALHKENERLDKELERFIYDDETVARNLLARDCDLANSPNREEWLHLHREEREKQRKLARYTGRYAWVLYLFSRAIQGCVTKDRAYDQEGWLDSIRKQLALLEKTPRPE